MPRRANPIADPSFLSRQVREHRYFFLHPHTGTARPLHVVCGGWEKCAPDYKIERSKFAFYGLEYVSGGSGFVTSHGVESKLLPGSIFAYGPSTKHTIRSDPHTPLVKYFIDFSGLGARRLIGQKGLGKRGIAYLHDSQPVHDLYEQILETGQKGGPLAQKLCASLLELLSLRLEENARTPSEIHRRSRQTFERCRAELQKHFRTLSSVAEMAERSHLDRAYLSRLFYRFTGESPYQLLIRLKMSEAAAQLFSGHYAVKEVAAQVGFSDPYHFSRVFKKHYGSSPSRFQDTRTRIIQG